MNSICLLFLVIGLAGASRPEVRVKPVPPLDPEIIPALIEPVVPTALAQPVEKEPEPEPADQEPQTAPPVVAVTLEAPTINFAVPTIGNLLVPNAMAQAPPLAPLAPPRPVTALKTLPTTLENTGAGGDRPAPRRYPPIAQEQGQQGAVTLLLQADAAGRIASVEVEASSGFPILDHDALEWVKRHWTLPSGQAGRRFEVTFNYRLPPH